VLSTTTDPNPPPTTHRPLNVVPLPLPFLLPFNMAKSLRCKVKKNARSKKRESGEYHIKDAERVARLNARLLENNSKKEVIGTDEVELKEGSGEGESAEEEAGEGGEDGEFGSRWFLCWPGWACWNGLFGWWDWVVRLCVGRPHAEGKRRSAGAHTQRRREAKLSLACLLVYTLSFHASL
jgi:hypothetical protein